jgi:hypothetical protein
VSKEQDLVIDIFSYKDDPLGFVLYAFPWGKRGTPLEAFPDGPDKWHVEMFLDLTKHIQANDNRLRHGEDREAFQSAIASGHGIGKSACVAWIIIWLMSTRRHCRGVVTANTGSQLEDKTWPELLKWHNMAVNKHWFNWTATQYTCVLEKGGEKNWKFDAVTWSEERTEAFAGSHNASSAMVVIFDEASAIPDVIWEVTEGAMTDGEAFWFAFGNPTRNTGRFKQCFGKLRDRWRTRNIDSRTVRVTNKKKLAEWVEDYGEDSDFVRVRVKGQFPRAGDKQFIPVDMVEEAQAREAHIDGGAPLIMGVDVARYGGDKAVIRFRQGLDAKSIKPLKYMDIDAPDLAHRIAEAMDKYQPDATFIDSGGGGAQVHDILKELGYRTTLVNFGGKSSRDDCANKRADMWMEMRNWLKLGAIDIDQELYDDLIGPEYHYDKHHRYVLESKDDMRKRGLASTDDGDALCVTFAMPVSRTDRKLSRRANRGMVAQDLDYDVFNY